MDAIQAYRESEITGDSPVRLVVLLYDQLLRDLRRARDAFEKQDTARRCQELDHALVVLAQLQGTLNLESGGEVAENLDRFYHLVRDNLVRASLEGSLELLETQWRQILAVREAWLEVENQQNPQAEKKGPPGTEGQAGNGGTPGNSEWKA
ncbi:MAG: flagellar export chaperone FliS [Terriglobales bacterium]